MDSCSQQRLIGSGNITAYPPREPSRVNASRALLADLGWEPAVDLLGDLRQQYANSTRSGKCQIMSLNFPNQSRFYDATRRAVRFWGHDSAMEAAFFVSEDALKRVQPAMRLDEAGLLGAFDANRDLIYAAAAKVYARGRKGSYDLVSADF
jgi:hypothetical protein